ncbi:FtsX-like permease family protein [uncultured Clostridium sp.]|jgi:hypothetical protein|uniref:FtsX-like permease family protein n=1 Tax=uncultured Clostridium sp. TaxID=59620 RepID=UPI00261D5101|nr:FtsX-like permease family protein [uncultured Clostridium sp.]
MFEKIFFGFKKSKLIYSIFLTILVSWGAIFSQTMSSINFEKNFTDKYNENLPVDSGIFLLLNITHDLQVQNKDNVMQKFKSIIQRNIEKNNISFLVAESIFFPKEDFDEELEKYKRGFVEDFKDSIEIVNMNYGYLQFLSERLDIDKSFADDKTTPVILGNNYKEGFKKGDIIKKIDQTFRVIGFFEKDVFYVDGPSPTMYFRPLDSAIVVPNKDLVSMNYGILTSNKNSFNINTLKKEINSITSIELAKTFEEDKVQFFNSENATNQNYLNKMKFIFMSFISILAINSIILFVIDRNKNKIGIIYSVGGTSRIIFNQLLKEFSEVLLIASIIGIPISYHFTKYSFMYFLNENRILTIVISSIVLIAITMMTIFISLLYLRKFSTANLIGGLRDE